jgi:hypothetical protein
MTAPTGAPQMTVIKLLPRAGTTCSSNPEFCIIWRIKTPCTGNTSSELTSEPRKIHKNAVVDFAFGDWEILAKVCSLGRVIASLQTEIHSETPDGGGNIGAFVGSFISTSKRLGFFIIA